MIRALMLHFRGGGGDIQKTQDFAHLTICISLHDIPSSCGSWLHGLVGKRHVSKSKVPGSNPTSSNCEKTHPCGAEEARRKTSSVIH